MGQRIGFTALLIFVKGKVKMVVGFEFTFDALQWCRQIYNLFAYSFHLGQGEVKYMTILTSPLTYKDKLKNVGIAQHF